MAINWNVALVNLRNFGLSACRLTLIMAFTLTASRRCTCGERRLFYSFPLASSGFLPSYLCRLYHLMKCRLSELCMSGRQEENRSRLKSPENWENLFNVTEEAQILGDRLLPYFANSHIIWIIEYSERMPHWLLYCFLKGSLVHENVSSLWSRDVH